MTADDTDGPEDERCDECGRLDPINCPCPTDEENDVTENETASRPFRVDWEIGR